MLLMIMMLSSIFLTTFCSQYNEPVQDQQYEAVQTSQMPAQGTIPALSDQERESERQARVGLVVQYRAQAVAVRIPLSPICPPVDVIVPIAHPGRFVFSRNDIIEYEVWRHERIVLDPAPPIIHFGKAPDDENADKIS